MLRKLNEIIGYKIAATDENIGSVDDFYFEDNTLSIRYVVADTGPWLIGKQVLIAPAAVGSPAWEGNILPVNLTKEQVKSSPDIGVDEPVSRQHEIKLHEHYGWPGYWYAAPGMATPMASPMSGVYAVPVPPVAVAPERELADAPSAEEVGDPHLRSVKEVIGYNIQATDGSIGHVEDFFADENDWRIRYVLIDTRNWWPGRKVLLSTEVVDRFDWSNQDLFVDVTREQVKGSPEYNPSAPLTRDYEQDLHTYYQYPAYWY